MSVIVKSIERNRGGPGGRGAGIDDFKDIFLNNGPGIKSIKIKSIKTQCGDVVYKLQFSYNIMIIDGESIVYEGQSFGQGYGGVDQALILDNNEQLTGINGRYGFFDNYTVINYLEFQTSQRNVSCGKYIAAGDTPFTLPAGVIYGFNGGYVDSIGTYVIEEAMQPITSITDNCPKPPLVLALSYYPTCNE
ncbi:hypothetical protein C1645_830250 [Glomus cerebriforme]|uniref:Jacalin-type lectin domain-containing protein n=1 Tax=Glomus cerebriforme TaxID=658196 RepID=A0A397ST12_9GLOM|nr:hypothetical protein C1645_830250 [Glomus cerebriforme]